MPGSSGKSLVTDVSQWPALKYFLSSGVLNTEHGACVIVPRENDYIRYFSPLITSWVIQKLTIHRLYTQLDMSSTGAISEIRRAKGAISPEAAADIDVDSVTPEEVLAQANRIFSPYKVTFGAALSWFAVWKGTQYSIPYKI